MSGRRARPVLVADLFCGAGGSSTGAARALAAMGRKMSLACVNHWPVAIETHQRNHPDAQHFCMDIEAVRPEDVVPAGWLDLLMASPTCTHHSRARGGKPTSDQQRMDPWHVVRWCTALRVRRLLVENVPEFMDWGPVDPGTGRPLASRRGEYFNAWIEALRAVGFSLDWRVLNAADYGDATTRRRFFLLGRSDGRAIRWPATTHAPAEKARLLGLRPWRAAREIIDWSRPGRSIFNRKRPLAAKTLQRIATGLARYGGEHAEPFLVVLRNNCTGQGIDLPLPTVTAGGSHLGLVQSFVLGQQSGAVARETMRPLPTIATGGAISLVEPFIAPYYGSGSGETGKAVSEPLDTVTTKARFGLVEPFLVPHFGERAGQSPRTHAVTAPLPTVTGQGAGSLVDATLTPASDVLAAGGQLVTIAGQQVVLDIRFRMLTNQELALAMGFDVGDGEYQFSGNKAEVTKQIGNAVPVCTSAALVTALFDREVLA